VRHAAQASPSRHVCMCAAAFVWVQFVCGVKRVELLLSNTCAPATGASTYVDMYNATSNRWIRYPEGLSEARYYLAASSLPSGLVFFAGGLKTGAFFAPREARVCVYVCAASR
jgi:hypothetical protein